MPDEIAPAVDECCDDLLEGDPHGSRFYQSAPQPIEKRHPMTAWIIGAFAFWIAEILVFEQWGYVTSVKLIGAAIAISGIVLMGVGLRRLKVASQTDGTEHSYWRGANAIILSAVLMSGVSLGQQLYIQKAWYWSMPVCSEVARACF